MRCVICGRPFSARAYGHAHQLAAEPSDYPTPQPDDERSARK